jgi:quinol monooxygenase YgiN
MSHTIVSYSVKSGREEENAALVRAVFEELGVKQPTGFRYAVFQASDSGEFIHIYTDEGAESGALQRLPAFQAFVGGAADRHAQPAEFKQFELVGAYRSFDDPLSLR